MEDLRALVEDVVSQDKAVERRVSYRGNLNIAPGESLVFSDSHTDEGFSDAHPEWRRVGGTLKAYRQALRSMLDGRYRDLSEIVPVHMRTKCDCLAILCRDGIIARYDRHEGDDEAKTRVGAVHEVETVTAATPVLSEGYVHLPIDPASFQFPATGPSIQLWSNSRGGVRAKIIDSRIGVVVPWGELREQATVRDRPAPLVSVTNEFDLLLEGELFDESAVPELGSGQPFVAKSHMKVRTGWEVFEVYPPFDSAVWDPSVAGRWAETDILAAVARRNVLDQRLQSVDPNWAARKLFARLFKEWECLLEGPEEPMQVFLKENPALLSPTHTRVWPKLKLGARVTDFVFRHGPNEYLLVEIEAPIRSLFRRDGQQHQELTHAIDQVTDWVRYIEDNHCTVERELGLTGISTRPRCLIVIGRSSELTPENRRKLTTIRNVNPTLDILTYDDLLASAKAAVENLLGPLWLTEGDVEVYYVPRK